MFSLYMCLILEAIRELCMQMAPTTFSFGENITYGTLFLVCGLFDLCLSNVRVFAGLSCTSMNHRKE